MDSDHIDWGARLGGVCISRHLADAFGLGWWERWIGPSCFKLSFDLDITWLGDRDGLSLGWCRRGSR